MKNVLFTFIVVHSAQWVHTRARKCGDPTRKHHLGRMWGDLPGFSGRITLFVKWTLPFFFLDLFNLIPSIQNRGSRCETPLVYLSFYCGDSVKIGLTIAAPRSARSQASSRISDEWKGHQGRTGQTAELPPIKCPQRQANYQKSKNCTLLSILMHCKCRASILSLDLKQPGTVWKCYNISIWEHLLPVLAFMTYRF